jgi:outer membrane protein
MKSLIVLILCMTIGIHIQAQAQPPAEKLTLRQCVETAINNNLNVNQSSLDMQAARVNQKQARANMLPTLFGAIDHGFNQGRNIDPVTNTYINQEVNFANYSLSSGVTLFNGLQLQNLVRQNTLAYDASKMEWQDEKDNITLAVILAYLQILNNEDQLIQSQNQAEVSRKQVERL